VAPVFIVGITGQIGTAFLEMNMTSNNDAMRKVAVFKWKRFEGEDAYSRVSDGFATFHEWGVNSEELTDGVGTCSAAIVERDNGSIELVAAEMIQFIEEPT